MMIALFKLNKRKKSKNMGKYTNKARLFGRTAKHLQIQILQAETQDERNIYQVSRMVSEVGKSCEMVGALRMYIQNKTNINASENIKTPAWQTPRAAPEMVKYNFKIPDRNLITKKLEFLRGIDMKEHPLKRKLDFSN